MAELQWQAVSVNPSTDADASPELARQTKRRRHSKQGKRTWDGRKRRLIGDSKFHRGGGGSRTVGQGARSTEVLEAAHHLCDGRVIGIGKEGAVAYRGTFTEGAKNLLGKEISIYLATPPGHLPKGRESKRTCRGVVGGLENRYVVERS